MGLFLRQVSCFSCHRNCHRNMECYASLLSVTSPPLEMSQCLRRRRKECPGDWKLHHLPIVVGIHPWTKFERSKNHVGVPQRESKLCAEPFANSSGDTSMNKIWKKQEPCGGPRKRKQIMYSNIIGVWRNQRSWGFSIRNMSKNIQSIKMSKALPAHSHPVQGGILCNW